MQYLFMILMLLTAVFLILLVLVQRGRGGGLTGALGGMGGQSAFGSKAGDLFTRITIGVAAFWILLCVGAIRLLNTPENVFGSGDESVFGTPAELSSEPGAEKKADNEDATDTSTSSGLSAPATSDGDTTGAAAAKPVEGGPDQAVSGGGTEETPAAPSGDANAVPAKQDE